MRPRVANAHIHPTGRRGLRRRWVWTLWTVRGIDARQVYAINGLTWTYAGANGALTRAAARLSRQHGGA